MTVLGAVLAAGAGTRFLASGGSGPKQSAVLDGATLLERALASALDAGLDEVVVVGGAVDLGALAVTVLPNPHWAEGIATSLRVALERGERGGHDAVATYDGRRGNPVRLARAVWADVPTTGDEGARALMRGRPDLVQEVPCDGRAGDIDTVEDLEGWS